MRSAEQSAAQTCEEQQLQRTCVDQSRRAEPSLLLLAEVRSTWGEPAWTHAQPPD